MSQIAKRIGVSAKRVGMVALSSGLFLALFLLTGILQVAPNSSPAETTAAYTLAAQFCLLLGLFYSYGWLQLCTLAHLLEWMLPRPPGALDDAIEFVVDFVSWFFMFFGPFFLTWGLSLVLGSLAANAGSPFTSLTVGSPGLLAWTVVSIVSCFSLAAYVFNTEDFEQIRDDYLTRKYGKK